MPDITGLGYVMVSTTDIDRWRTLALEVLDLGEGEGPNSDNLYLRLDERAARLIIAPGDEDKVQIIGWETRDRFGCERLKNRLTEAGVDVRDLTQDEVDERRVQGGIAFTDPSGHPTEIFYGPSLNHAPLGNKYGTRYVTGKQGMGHVVIPATSEPESLKFYNEVLEFYPRGAFRITPPGAPPMHVNFLSTNTRHHTLAMMPAPSMGAGLVHIMIEAETLDDVGRALDRSMKDEFSISSTLGRHTNDKMVSFYVRAPGGWDIEYGWGGLQVDEEGYTAELITADSYWGHDWSGSEPLSVMGG